MAALGRSLILINTILRLTRLRGNGQAIWTLLGSQYRIMKGSMRLVWVKGGA